MAKKSCGNVTLDERIESMLERKVDADNINSTFEEVNQGNHVNDGDGQRLALLCAAIHFEHRALILYLLKSNVLGRRCTPSPIVAAIRKDDPELFELLIQHGADVHVKLCLQRGERQGLWTCKDKSPIDAIVEQDDVSWLSRVLPHYIPGGYFMQF